jgi:hypothetical protein
MKRLLVIYLVIAAVMAQIMFLSGCDDNNSENTCNSAEDITDNDMEVLDTHDNHQRTKNNFSASNGDRSEGPSIINPEGNNIIERIQVPEGFERIKTSGGSFANYLQNLPLKPHGSNVRYYDGRIKGKKVHDAVIDMDVGKRDLLRRNTVHT